MKIEVKIMPKEEYNEENLGWSEPVPIEEFILNPSEVEFEWGEECSLSYNDFIFFGEEYYYGIFINDKLYGEFERYLDEIEEKAQKYDELG